MLVRDTSHLRFLGQNSLKFPKMRTSLGLTSLSCLRSLEEFSTNDNTNSEDRLSTLAPGPPGEGGGDEGQLLTKKE